MTKEPSEHVAYLGEPHKGWGSARNIYQCGKCGLPLYIDVSQRDIRWRYVYCWDCGAINET